MESNLLKQLFSIKYAVTDELIRHLPHPLRERAVTIHEEFVTAVRDAATSYLNNRPEKGETSDKEKGLKNVSID